MNSARHKITCARALQLSVTTVYNIQVYYTILKKQLYHTTISLITGDNIPQSRLLVWSIDLITLSEKSYPDLLEGREDG